MPVLSTCFLKNQAECKNVRDTLHSMTGNLSAGTDIQRLYATLLAIYVLTEVFSDKAD